MVLFVVLAPLLDFGIDFRIACANLLASSKLHSKERLK